MAHLPNEHLKKDFYVIAVMTNPERYKVRPRLFKEFVERMEKEGVNLVIAEAAFGDRDFEVTVPDNPSHIQLRSSSEIWLKENLINVAITRLPQNWKYVAWVDADITFLNPNWVMETIHELQHHPVVQMFADAIDGGPNGEVMTVFKSFCYCYRHGLAPLGPVKTVTVAAAAATGSTSGQDNGYTRGDGTLSDGRKPSPGTYWHPGYAWAATRTAINIMGGLLDTAVLGSGDHHMACSLIGDAQRSLPKGIHKNYSDQVFAWQERALRLHRSIGYVKGTIYHHWHGKKIDRKYNDRWTILIENKYDPVIHIHKDWQGLWSLHPGHDILRDKIREYFCVRNEDSIDL
jgi:hypothetical protein